MKKKVIALIMLFVTSAACVGFFEAIKKHLDDERLCFDDTSEYAQYLSRGITYYDGVYGKDGYVKDSNGEKTVTGIKWIAKPLGDDSLVCYSNGKKRGYFNMFTGKTVIKPQYEHAWIFSEGLASVVDRGWIKFINHSGQVVIDPKIPYFDGSDGYVFHNGYCVVHNNRRNRVGLIDKQVSNHEFDKRYYAIVAGQVTKQHGLIEAPLKRKEGENFQIVSPDGRQAVTEYWLKANLAGGSLVEVKLHTGRTHQIRVHFQSKGHPLLGDELYKGPLDMGIERQALHAYHLAFNDPFTNKRLVVEAPLPSDMKSVLAKLKVD